MNETIKAQMDLINEGVKKAFSEVKCYVCGKEAEVLTEDEKNYCGNCSEELEAKFNLK